MEPTTAAALVRLLPALLLLGGAWWLARRFSRRTQAGTGLRAVSRATLSRSASVAVVEAGSRHFLVGVGDGGVSLLAELDHHGAQAAQPTTVLSAPTTPAMGWGGGDLLERLRARTVRPAKGVVDVPLR